MGFRGLGRLGPLQIFRFVWHLPSFVRLYWRLFNDSRVSVIPKALLLAAIAYVLSPVDILPDWFPPILGEVDDIVVIALALKLFISLSPRHVVQEHVQRISDGR
jgi:uncharacterized membrane protein YkvA (DUF1232 family)